MTEESTEHDKDSTEGMNMAQKFQHRRAKDAAARMADKQRTEQMKKREIEQLKVKFEEFSHCIVQDTTLQTYNKFFEAKLKSRHKPKTKLTDLGRANIDSYVLMKQMRMNDSKNEALLQTDNTRASLKDHSALRAKDYLGQYLERVTHDVKVPQHQVPALQAGFEPQPVGTGSRVFGVNSSFATGIGQQTAPLNNSMASNGSLVQILPILKSDRKQNPYSQFHSTDKFGGRFHQTDEISAVKHFMQKRGTDYRPMQNLHATVVDVEVSTKNIGTRNKSVSYHIPCPDKTLSKIENNKQHSKNIATNNSKKLNQAAQMLVLNPKLSNYAAPRASSLIQSK